MVELSPSIAWKLLDEIVAAVEAVDNRRVLLCVCCCKRYLFVKVLERIRGEG